MACCKIRKLALSGRWLTLILALCVLSPANNTSANGISKTYTGHISIWPESRVFKPCDSKTVHWITAGPETLRKLAAEHQRLQPKPYGATYIVIEGTPGPQLICGFCQDYPASMHINKVIEHRAERAGDCPK